MSGWHARIPRARAAWDGCGGNPVDGEFMSLINKMLQDLDTRRAAYGVGTALPNDVRPLPKPQASRLPFILAGMLLIVLVGGFVVYQLQMRQEAAAPVVPVPVAVDPVAAVSVPLPTIAQPTSEQEISAQSVLPRAEQEAVATPSLGRLDGSLRMADLIKPTKENIGGTKPAVSSSVAPRAVAVSSGKPMPAEKKSADERNKVEPAERALPALAATAPQVAGKSARTPMIERSDSVGTPRDRAETEYRKAIAAVNQGRIEEALESLRNSLRQDGLHSASRQLLVKLLLEAKRPDEAIQALHDGLQGQPAQTGWAMSLARLQVDRGDLAGAWQTLDYSLPAAVGNADYQGFAAHVLQRLGRNKEASERYQAASRLSPADGRWWLGLGLVLDAEGRSAEAREAYLRARQSGNLSAELMVMIEQKLR